MPRVKPESLFDLEEDITSNGDGREDPMVYDSKRGRRFGFDEADPEYSTEVTERTGNHIPIDQIFRDK